MEQPFCQYTEISVTGKITLSYRNSSYRKHAGIYVDNYREDKYA